MAEPALASMSAVGARQDGSGQAQLPNAAYLLESLVSDVHSLAQHVATLSLMISASLRADAKWTLRACRHLVHADFKPLTLALRFSGQIGLAADVAARLSNLCRGVSAAQERVVPILQFSAGNKQQRDQIQVASDEWRRLALGMAAALTAIEPTVRARLIAAYGDDLNTLRGFLTRAGENDTSAVDAAGVVRAPVLKQRRRVPRVAVNAPCSVETADGLHPARLKDASRRGVGLICEIQLSVGQKVEVVLQDGRRLLAKIVRGQRPNFGLALAAPLSDSDPLLAGGAR